MTGAPPSKKENVNEAPYARQGVGGELAQMIGATPESPAEQWRVHFISGNRYAVATYKYKPVSKKVRPKEGELPERLRVKRRPHPNPL